eukprot:scaffold52144_cov33-Tisochrysis_lutea.AAC.1
MAGGIRRRRKRGHGASERSQLAEGRGADDDDEGTDAARHRGDHHRRCPRPQPERPAGSRPDHAHSLLAVGARATGLHEL